MNNDTVNKYDTRVCIESAQSQGSTIMVSRTFSHQHRASDQKA